MKDITKQPPPPPLNKTDKRISVGIDYQVPLSILDSYTGPNLSKEVFASQEREICLWKPNSEYLRDEVIRNYCIEALENYNLNSERALYILYKANYDVEMARKKLERRHNFENNFTEDDSYIFRNAYACYGKDFRNIQRVIPYKSTKELVDHYYRTKKRQNYRELYDQHILGNDESESDVNLQKGEGDSENNICENCKNPAKSMFPANDLSVCRTCQIYFRAMNQHRPDGMGKNKKNAYSEQTLSSDMLSLVDEFKDLVEDWDDISYEDADDDGELQIAQPKISKCQALHNKLEKDISKSKAKIAELNLTIKQELSQASGFDDALKKAKNFIMSTANQPGDSRQRSSHIWTQNEELATIYAMKRFKNDFHIVSKVLGAKTPEMIKAYYLRNKKLFEMSFEDFSDSVVTEVKKQNSEIIELD